jgi:hypothetical protein
MRSDLSPQAGRGEANSIDCFSQNHPVQAAFWQCAQVPVISTTESFGEKPEARAAADRLCATGAAGISPTEPQRSQIKNATSAAES